MLSSAIVPVLRPRLTSRMMAFLDRIGLCVFYTIRNSHLYRSQTFTCCTERRGRKEYYWHLRT